MPKNSGIIAAMQRIHYHTGRQAGRPASKQAEGRGRRKRKPGEAKRGKGKPNGDGEKERVLRKRAHIDTYRSLKPKSKQEHGGVPARQGHTSLTGKERFYFCHSFSELSIIYAIN